MYSICPVTNRTIPETNSWFLMYSELSALSTWEIKSEKFNVGQLKSLASINWSGMFNNVGRSYKWSGIHLSCCNIFIQDQFDSTLVKLPNNRSWEINQLYSWIFFKVNSQFVMLWDSVKRSNVGKLKSLTSINWSEMFKIGNNHKWSGKHFICCNKFIQDQFNSTLVKLPNYRSWEIYKVSFWMLFKVREAIL